MPEEKRQNPGGRRQGRDRRNTRASAQQPAYTGVERRVGERRVGMNRRGPR
jgi:hypothetical protein